MAAPENVELWRIRHPVPGSGPLSDGLWREAPVERKELLGHGRETEPLGALARPAPHPLSAANIQPGEPEGKGIDLETADHIAIHALLEQFRSAAWREGDDAQAAGHCREGR